MGDDARWRYLDMGPAPGQWHMAVDLAIHAACARGDAPPTLRVYGFQPICLSLGRHQRDETMLKRCYELGLPWVRRPTGGGAVLHAGDVCYSVVAPVGDPTVGGPLRRSYCQVAVALVRALRLLGLESAQVCEGAAHPPRGGPCFASPAPLEVTAFGAKLVGNAQWRRGGTILIQGSLRTHAHAALERVLFGLPLGPTMSQLLGRELRYEEVAEALRDGFAQALGLRVEPQPITLLEEELAGAFLLQAQEDTSLGL
jgi:lipoate-protein ligase A